MTRQQKRRQRQRLWCEALQLIKETKRKKNVERNQKRQERRKRAARGLLTTQPAYHEKLRNEAAQRGAAHNQQKVVKLQERRDRLRRKVAIYLAANIQPQPMKAAA